MLFKAAFLAGLAALAPLGSAHVWRAEEAASHPAAVLNLLATDPKRTHHSRGEFRNDWIAPECTAGRHRKTHRFPDGTSFVVCEPGQMDKAFGMYGHHQSLAAQSMSFIPMDEEHFEEERGLINSALAEFTAPYKFQGPGGVGIGTFLRQIFVFYQLMIGGGDAEGAFFYEPGDTLWLSKPDPVRHPARFRRTMHHELAHLLAENLVGAEKDDARSSSWRGRWKAALPKQFVYTAKNYARPSYWFTPMSYETGFLTGYNRASMEEDIAQFASALVVGHPELWKCHDAGTRCAAKVELVVELYAMISPKYTKAYFKSIAREAHDTGKHTVVEGPLTYAMITSMMQATDEIKMIDESFEAYVEEAVKLDRTPEAKPDPQPRFGVDPRPVRVGSETVQVYVETTPRQKFFGNTEMSDRAVYTPESPENVPRSMEIATTWARYLTYGTGGAVKRIAIAGKLHTPNEVYGVFFPDPVVNDIVFLGPHITKTNRFHGETNWDSAKTLRWARTLTHESTHCIANAFYHRKLGASRDPLAWRRDFITANSHGFEYLGRGAPGTSLEFEESMFKHGFLSGYSRVSLDEDIAQTGAALLIGAPEIWACARASPICNKKIDLVVELFAAADRRYTRAFFESRANGGGNAPTEEFPTEVDDGEKRRSWQFFGSRK
eukprot:TRINITY_DN4343_c0_g3_i1.p1 TRINITY_DN4343_c0_g3~~TRINITY_DN4343_c0_g3_i1.p1  ORF type:complete len:688 (-),score=356.82 TRINITY_DN4343_c0_g3_i1:86-2074(-)